MFSDESLFCGEKLNQLKKYFFLLIGIEKKSQWPIYNGIHKSFVWIIYQWVLKNDYF